MILLLQSALRALLLGAAVWALLRLLKLRDARSETAAWTLVLAAALAMPLLTPLLERWLPGASLPATGHGAGALAPVGSFGLVAHVVPLLWTLYVGGMALMLARLATGLVLSQRLYRRTVKVADGIRIGAAVRSPMVFGRCILLPLEWQHWPEAKRAAVLAHEQRHIARGDFFLQLAAALYRAFFWFSPFAWWLQRQLCALAERDSDAAAVRRIGDPASYAELLVDEARHAQGMPALVAMANGPDIAWRVEHILTGDEAEQTPSVSRRTLAAALMLAASLGFAGAHAAAPAKALLVNLAAKPVAAAAQPQAVATLPAPATAARARPARQEVRYDPRALLRDPKAVMVRGLLVMTNG